jgi:hypothetical protein
MYPNSLHNKITDKITSDGVVNNIIPTLQKLNISLVSTE